MGSRFDQNPGPSFVIEPDPISEQRWPDDGRRCRGEPPLRGGHFFKSPQHLGCCLDRWSVCEVRSIACLAIGIPAIDGGCSGFRVQNLGFTVFPVR